MRRTLATIGAALAIGIPSGVLVNASLSGPEYRTITASANDTFLEFSTSADEQRTQFV